MNDIAFSAKIRRPTMIKGLIPTLPERGKIKIGVKGAMVTSRHGTEFQPPQKLDHFVVTTLQRGEDGNFIPDDALMQRLGDKPTEIPVRLLYDDPTLNFPTRYACFVGRSLWCSGDGEVAIRAMPSGPQEVPCTCERADPAYKRNDKCKMNGSLSVLIEGAGGIGGVWKFRTTSYNSIVGIMSTMAFMRSMTGGVLANIPLKLKVQPKQATAPDGNPVTIYFVSLEFDGDMPGLQEIAHGIALGRAKMNISIEHIEDEARKLLALAPPANVPLAGDNADDVIEEFYPEQAARPPADTRAALDAFAAAKPAEVFDAETGEVIAAPALEHAAKAAATSTDSLRSYLRTLSREARASLNGKIGTRDEPGEILRMAMRADAEIGAGEDPFGLPPLQRGEPQPQEDPRLRRLRQLRRTAGIPDGKETPDAILLEAGYSQEEINKERSTRGWPQPHSSAGGQPADGARDEPADQPSPAPAGEHAIPDLLGGEPRPASRAYQLPPRPTQKDLQAFADWIDGELADGVSGRLLRANNDTTLRHMKVNVPDMYNVVQSKLGAL